MVSSIEKINASRFRLDCADIGIIGDLEASESLMNFRVRSFVYLFLVLTLVLDVNL